MGSGGGGMKCGWGGSEGRAVEEGFFSDLKGTIRWLG